MRSEHISDYEVSECIAHFDYTEPTVLGRTNYYGRLARGLRIRVTAIEENDEFVIITVTPMRRGRHR
jgi:hypothetical protein